MRHAPERIAPPIPPPSESATLPLMGALSEDMKRVVSRQRLGFYATVNEDGSPNLSPKGSTFVLDDERLFFADYRSPQTVENIRRGSLVEVNVVDPLSRKGYRFKGPAVVHEPGTDLFDRCVAPAPRWRTALATSWWWRFARRGPWSRPSTTTARSASRT